MIAQPIMPNRYNDQQASEGLHPKKLLLTLLIVSICMMFAAFTSAYIVRRAEGNWLDFELPSLFLYTSIIIVLSSITMQWAQYSAKKDNLETMRLMLGLTALLGVAFLVGQYMAWADMVANNVFFGGDSANPSGSFLYVLTGLHGFHIITGLIFLIIVLISAFQYKVHSKSMLRIDLCTIYWHFLGALWMYLYIFVLINH